jgi:acetyl-CoA hydrolase
MVSHVDHTEHDIAVIVTEQGLADVRGMAPRQRAKEIINKCAHPDYKDILLDYYERAENDCIARGAGHEPQLLEIAHKMHVNLLKNGTMKVKW